MSTIVKRSRNLRKTWGASSRPRADKFGQANRGPQWETLPHIPPPPYTERSLLDRNSEGQPKSTTPPTTPTQTSAEPYPLLAALVEEQGSNKRWNCDGLFYWSIVHIMAVTFSANLPKLQTAVANDFTRTFAETGGSTSFLTEQAQAEVEQLCVLIRNLAADPRLNRWPAVRQCDKILLIHLVLKPAQLRNIPVDYALELLGRYRHVETGGVVKTETAIDYWTPTWPTVRPRCTAPMLDLGDTLASHASLIASLNLRQETAAVLTDALASFRAVRGMDKLQNSRELQEETISRATSCLNNPGTTAPCLRPVTRNYENLAKALRQSGDMPDVCAQAQRSRLRIKRRHRSYFQPVRG